MKRIQTIGPTLFLAIFLLALVAPSPVLAAACVEQDETPATNCEGSVKIDCDCGNDIARKDQFCDADTDNDGTLDGAVYANKADCDAGRRALPPAAFRLGAESEVPRSGTALLGRVQLISNWVFAIFLVISLIYIILAAFQFVTGAGDPAQVSGARQKLIYAAVGIAIALIAAGFPLILRNIVT